MDMTNPLESVLTHGGHSDTAVASTIQTHTETHEAQEDTVLGSDRRDVAPERHLHYEEPEAVAKVDHSHDYPKILHSIEKFGHELIVKGAVQEQEALDSGKWSTQPLEKVKAENGEIEYRASQANPDPSQKTLHLVDEKKEGDK